MEEDLEDFAPIFREFMGIVLVLRDVMDNLAGIFDDARKEVKEVWQKI